jgi:hypothetical protein
LNRKSTTKEQKKWENDKRIHPNLTSSFDFIDDVKRSIQ